MTMKSLMLNESGQSLTNPQACCLGYKAGGEMFIERINFIFAVFASHCEEFNEGPEEINPVEADPDRLMA